jgi:CheY-like chemotaxis protein
MNNNGIKNMILCVDDDRLILDTLQLQLQSMFGSRFTYDIAESGQEAMEILEDCAANGCQPTLVISDWQMPGMKGDRLLLLTKKKFKNTKTLLLTGLAPEETIQQALSAGVGDCIQKPWSSVELKSVIEDLLNE